MKTKSDNMFMVGPKGTVRGKRHGGNTIPADNK